MIWTLIEIGFLIGSYIYGQYRARKAAEENAKKLVAGSFTVPKFEEGTALPLFYGTVKLTPIVIQTDLYTADSRREEVAGDSVVVGFLYRIMMRLLLGVPGTSEIGTTSVLRRLYVDDRVAWSGLLNDDVTIIHVEQMYLLGGDGQGGGVEGFISYLPGTTTQENNNTVKAALSHTNANQELAYRGQAVLTLFGAYDDDANPVNHIGGYGWTGNRFDGNTGLDNPTYQGWLIGESPQIAPYSVEVTAPTSTTSLGATLRGIGYDANPANVLYDLLIRSWNRVGLQAGTIDAPSFLAAGQTLETEGHGISFALSTANDASEGIKLVLEQTESVFTYDMTTGTIGLKLIRNDYGAISGLPLINPNNAVRIDSYAVGNWNETYTTVRVTYTDRSRHYIDGVAFAQNQALIFALGKERVREINYPGCATRQLANQLAARELKALSRPLARLKITVDRTLYDMKAGDVFRLRWARFGIVDQVFRILRVDTGTKGQPQVQFECAEDVFAIDHETFRIPSHFPIPPRAPFPSTERIVEEAPRWVNVRARDLGRINDPDVPRAHHLALPRGIASTYHAEVTLNGSPARDIEPQPFPAYATVETDYAREVEPYDTSTGLRITGLTNITDPGSQTDDEISKLGHGLVRVGDEIMAYEASFNLGAGVWKLGNVWRGLLDTAAVAHVAGERVWFLANDTGFAVSRVGRVSWKPNDTTIAARQVVNGEGVRVRPLFRAAITGVTPSPQIPAAIDDDLVNEQTSLSSTIVSRTTLAYPPSDINLNGTKTPDRLEEGGIDMTWVRRNRLTETIVRGDESDEEPEAFTKYRIVAKRGDASPTVAQFGSPFDYTATAAEDVVISNVAYGYGTVDIGVQALTPVLVYTDPVSGLHVYQDKVSWHTPYLTIDAPSWRNLFLDGRFEDGLLDDPVQLSRGWRTFGGTPEEATSASGLGGAGYYIHATTGTTTIVKQKVSVDGFRPGNLTALVHYYRHNLNGDTNDTLTVLLEALDGADSAVASATSGAIVPSATQWDHVSLTLTAPATATQLRVTITMTEVATGAATADSAVTEVIVRLGQTDGTQLLTNPYFGSGSLVGWTTGSGAFAYTTTAPIYEGAGYAHATGSGAGELYQDVSLPGGYEVNATALIECSRMDAAGGDQGEVVLEARDGGGSVLDSVTTGMEHVATGTWERRRLALDIPEGTVTLRTRLKTTDHGAFDDVDLRVYKHLDADTERAFSFDTPASQPVPSDLDFFDRAWPMITPPDVGFWAGAFAGVLGVEPILDADDTAAAPPFEAGKFIGPYDATNAGAVVSPGIVFPPDCDSALTVGNRDFALFTSLTSFTFFWNGRIGPDQLALAPGLFHRALSTGGGGGSGVLGWQVYLDNSGLVNFKIGGLSNEVTLTGTRMVADGAPHLFAVSYDADTQTAYLVDEDGVQSASTAAIGEFAIETAYFTIGALSTGDNILGNSVLGNWFAWRSAVATADLQSMMTYGGKPFTQLSAPRYDSTWLACVVGTDADGVVVSRFDSKQVAIGYSPVLKNDGGTGYGLVVLRERTNQVTDAQQVMGSADWYAVGGAIVAENITTGPEGFKTAASISGTNAKGLELRNVTAGSAATKTVMWSAKSAIGHTARLEFYNESGVLKETHDYAVTQTWAVYSHIFTAWDDSTPTCRLRFCPTNGAVLSAGFNLCGPFFLDELPSAPPCIPLGVTASGYSPELLIDVTDIGGGLPLSFNADGEIEVVGVSVDGVPPDGTGIVDVLNNVNDDDFRALYVDTSGELKMIHYDGAGASNTSSVAAQTDWNAKWVARGRWCEAGLLDAASKFAGAIRCNASNLAAPILDGAPAAYGRTATWTPGTAHQIIWIEIGVTQIGDPMDFICRSVTVRSREERLL